MTTTYLAMSIPFLVWTAVATAVAAWKFGLRLRGLALPIGALLVGTAIFDNLIIWSGLVAYDESKILGWRVGLAPVEDFLYAIAAVMLTASMWHILGRRSSR